MSALHALADLLDWCEPEDDAPVTWGALRRQVREAAKLDAERRTLALLNNGRPATPEERADLQRRIQQG